MLLICLFFIILCSHRCCCFVLFFFKYFLWKGYELSGEIALKNNHYYYIDFVDLFWIRSRFVCTSWVVQVLNEIVFFFLALNRFWPYSESFYGHCRHSLCLELRSFWQCYFCLLRRNQFRWRFRNLDYAKSIGGSFSFCSRCSWFWIRELSQS